jgi:adiponectin receptor
MDYRTSNDDELLTNPDRFGYVLPNYLHSHDEIPDWYKDNEFIKEGYRKWEMKTSYYTKSIVSCPPHNETFNIWTHLVGTLAFIGLMIYSNATHLIEAPYGDKVAVDIFLTSVILCFALSTLMHIYYPCSEKKCKQLLKMDYIGISCLILGSYGPFVYFAFYCEPLFQWIYYTVINILGIAVIVLTFSDFFHKSEYRAYRALTFVLFVGSVIVPIVHRFVLDTGETYQLEFDKEVKYSFFSCIFYGMGAFIFAKRIPERWYSKHFCHIYLSSHKIFHVLTILGALTTYYGMLQTHKIARTIECTNFH